MSNPTNNRRNQRIQNIAIPDGTSVAEFSNYAGAVDCVDQLIRHGFPAPMAAIVGTNLSTVERVRGRLSYGRVALQGALTGSWLGLIVGILFTDPAAAAATGGASPVGTLSLGAAILLGAGVGMLANVLRFSFARKSHEFLSSSAVVAASYSVVVPHDLANQATQAINEHRTNCINGEQN